MHSLINLTKLRMLQAQRCSRLFLVQMQTLLCFHRCLDKKSIHFSPKGNGTDYCDDMLIHYDSSASSAYAEAAISTPKCCNDRDLCNENLTISILRAGQPKPRAGLIQNGVVIIRIFVLYAFIHISDLLKWAFNVSFQAPSAQSLIDRMNQS